MKQAMILAMHFCLMMIISRDIILVQLLSIYSFKWCFLFFPPFVAVFHSPGMRYPLLWRTRSSHKLSYQMKFWRYRPCSFYRTQHSILLIRRRDQFDFSHFSPHSFGATMFIFCVDHVNYYNLIVLVWLFQLSIAFLPFFIYYFIGFRAVCCPLFCLEAARL
jgi:hypothetical protein